MNPTILLLVNDVFFSVKLENDLRRLGYAPITVRRVADLPTRLAADPRPALVLLDLMIRGENWEQALREARGDGLLDDIAVIAFGPHTDLALRRRALDVGVTRMVANSTAMRDIGKLVGKYLAAPNASISDDNEGEEE